MFYLAVHWLIAWLGPMVIKERATVRERYGFFVLFACDSIFSTPSDEVFVKCINATQGNPYIEVCEIKNPFSLCHV